MKESVKCCLISMGIGFVVGAFLAVNNKCVANKVKETQEIAVEKLEMAKEGIDKVKEKVSDQIENSQKQQTQNKSRASK